MAVKRFEASAVLALLLVSPFTVRAQSPESSGQRHAALERLADSQVVRLSAPGIRRRQGVLLRPDTADLLLISEGAPLRIPAVSVDTLWTRGGSSGTGALVGAILGAGLGVLAGHELGEENAGSASNVLGMAGIGAIGGSLLGAVFGAPIPRWNRRFP
jgi:hypothetical protein